MSNPTVSVIVPVYNAEKYICRCLDSILSQSMRDWEVILVDDGSPDNSGKICDEYAKKDSRFRAIHKENGGVSSARERGMQECVGEYVIHVDPDDWIESDMLQKLYDKAHEDNSDMLICDFFEKWRWGEKIVSQNPISLDHVSVLHQLFDTLHGSCCNKLVRRELFNKFDVHFPKGMNFCEDLFVNTALLKNDIKITYLPKAFYHYDHKTNPASIVNDKKKSRQRAITKVEGLRPLLEHDYPGLLERIQLGAKYTFLSSGAPFSAFREIYKDVNGKIWSLENNYTKDHLISFAIKNLLCYWAAYTWIRFKDLCFTLRHPHKR